MLTLRTLHWPDDRQALLALDTAFTTAGIAATLEPAELARALKPESCFFFHPDHFVKIEAAICGPAIHVAGEF